MCSVQRNLKIQESYGWSKSYNLATPEVDVLLQVLKRLIRSGELLRSHLLVYRCPHPEVRLVQFGEAKVNCYRMDLTASVGLLPACRRHSIVIQPRHTVQQERVRQLHGPNK
jgi:hypothetical protein